MQRRAVARVRPGQHVGTHRPPRHHRNRIDTAATPDRQFIARDDAGFTERRRVVERTAGAGQRQDRRPVPDAEMAGEHVCELVEAVRPLDVHDHVGQLGRRRPDPQDQFHAATIESRRSRIATCTTPRGHWMDLTSVVSMSRPHDRCVQTVTARSGDSSPQTRTVALRTFVNVNHIADPTRGARRGLRT